MPSARAAAAVDFGASSGRVILRHVGPDTPELDEAPIGLRVYGVSEDELGEVYASRTLLNPRSCPSTSAAAFAMTGGDLSQTTGLLVPVDSGLAAAFLR